MKTLIPTQVTITLQSDGNTGVTVEARRVQITDGDGESLPDQLVREAVQRTDDYDAVVEMFLAATFAKLKADMPNASLMRTVIELKPVETPVPQAVLREV